MTNWGSFVVIVYNVLFMGILLQIAIFRWRTCLLPSVFLPYFPTKFADIIFYRVVKRSVLCDKESKRCVREHDWSI